MEHCCPICRTAVANASAGRRPYPFCSARCRDVDLGRWLDGAYRVPVTDEAPTEEELALAVAVERTGFRGDA